ncbi:MAG: LPXTG cell wall anchor domain-containing protein [Eubacteriales bacterium]|nr:LPXTG cell wall anchor domain-containing protein [Eubacteriales bacterium]
MKKLVILASMMVMLFSFTLTANAEASPEGIPYTPPVQVTVETPAPQPETNVSPKTGENQEVLFGLGMAAVIFAAGAVATGRKAKNA